MLQTREPYETWVACLKLFCETDRNHFKNLIRIPKKVHACVSLLNWTKPFTTINNLVTSGVELN